MKIKPLIATTFFIPLLSTAAIADNHIWDGVYFGALAGLTSGTLDGATTTGTNATKTDLSGGTVGLTAGINFTNENFLFGAEGDVSASGVQGSTTCGAGQTCKNTEKWNATIRGRLGVIKENALFYATAGAAFSNGTSTTTPATAGTTGTFSSTFTGWTAGVGAEVATNDNTRIKFEYLYSDYGSTTAPAGTVGAVAFVGKQKSNQFRIGINRSF